MKVGLFIPCYIDTFYPHVGIATYNLLKKYGCEVEYPMEQTCCGQPMANSGCERDAIKASKNLVNSFKDYEYIVCPSGSCVMHVHEHFGYLPQTEEVKKVRHNTYELTQFLHDVLQANTSAISFPHKVGLHISCHGQRGMRLAQSSEIVGEDYSIMRDLLSPIQNIELINLTRKDECCGFGGTFAVSEEAVSCSMGNDRIRDHYENGTEVITGGDMSCLMHLEGLVKRQELPLKIMHIAEILDNE